MYRLVLAFFGHNGVIKVPNLLHRHFRQSIQLGRSPMGSMCPNLLLRRTSFAWSSIRRVFVVPLGLYAKPYARTPTLLKKAFLILKLLRLKNASFILKNCHFLNSNIHFLPSEINEALFCGHVLIDRIHLTTAYTNLV